MPQRIINLGEYEFVSFVNHTLMCEQKLFGKKNEINCDIMFLAERNGKTRLMSFKSNPWLNLEEQSIRKESIYISSGYVNLEAINAIEQKKNKSMPSFGSRVVSNRFQPDKIQTVHLVSKITGTCH